MRVVAGELRGRRIEAPGGKTTRPTTDKVREAVFNALGSINVVIDAVVVDLFAGSGALGIEALSRGAASCTFIEGDRKAVACIKSNLQQLGLEPRATVVQGDVMVNLTRAAGADVVLADPPYGFTNWGGLLAVLAEKCDNRKVLFVAESDEPLENVEGWEIVRSKRYGGTWVSFFQQVP